MSNLIRDKRIECVDNIMGPEGTEVDIVDIPLSYKPIQL
jgi:hypothetical protein